METGTHYTDSRGQHYLPACLRNRHFQDGDLVVSHDELDELNAPEYDGLKDAIRALGWQTEIDGDGLRIQA